MTDDQNRVRELPLPAGATAPVSVYLNGTELREGSEFALVGHVIQFAVPVRAQPPLGVGRKIMLAMGIGVYGDLRGDSLDIHYQLDGRPQALTDLRVRSTAAGSSP